jgi:hypothetical protein
VPSCASAPSRNSTYQARRASSSSGSAGGPLRFDAGDDRWGKKVKTARDCVSELYHLKQQPLAHIGHADLLVDWLQGLDAEIAARAAGESGGGAAS